jgi:SAM-dependent methyltransferase
MANAYAEDLAWVHDHSFDGHARGAASFLLEALGAAAGDVGGHIADLGCGSGTLAGEMLAAGYEVTGVDISSAMIALAKKRVPKARFVRGSLLSARLPKSTAIACVGECVNYLFDAGLNDRKLERLFGRAFAALEPGGLFLLDAAGPTRITSRRQSHFLHDDFAVLVDIEADRERALLARHITTYRRRGASWRRSDETHRLKLHAPSKILRMLRGAGFRARPTNTYGLLPQTRGWHGYLARKPA